MTKTKEYNLTNLDVYSALERGISHRDWYGHLFRFTHALKLAHIGMNILDVGAGPGELVETFYRNRFKPNKYVGLEFRQKEVDKANDKYKDLGFAEFKQFDVVKQNIKESYPDTEWDMITSFEVAEHLTKKHVPAFLKNIKDCMSSKTIALISTPIYDPVVGPADNHVINGEIGEMTYFEFQSFLEEAGLKVRNNFATFCSIKDYKQNLKGEFKILFDRLHSYYDVNVLSVLIAPMLDPKLGRNCLWECTL